LAIGGKFNLAPEKGHSRDGNALFFCVLEKKECERRLHNLVSQPAEGTSIPDLQVKEVEDMTSLIKKK
jgi:hypothetical protein